MPSLYASNPKSSLASGSISTFSTAPESFVFAILAVAKPLKSLKKLTRLSVLAPLQNRPVKWKSAKTPKFLHFSTLRTTLPSENLQGSRVDVPPTFSI